MRILPDMPLSEGYEPGFVPMNQDEGILEISHPSVCHLHESAKIVGETLTLRCTLRPLPRQSNETKVQLISENIPLESSFLYATDAVTPGFEWEVEQSHWKGIAVNYAGIGHIHYPDKTIVFYGKTLPMGHLEGEEVLYIKPFCTQSSSCHLRVTTLGHEQVLTSPPGVVNTKVLRGYGGHYYAGVPLANIEQIYYGLTSYHATTKIRLYSSSFLLSRGISPPLGGRDFSQSVLFNPAPTEEELLSFEGCIAAGYAPLSVRTEFGLLTYRSFVCESVSGHPNFINIHFKLIS